MPGMNPDLQIKAHNIFAVSELGELLGSLNKDDISVIVLKGASLLGTLYEKDYSRPMYDIDLLTRRADLVMVDERLIRLGYKRLSHNWGSHITYRKTGPLSIPVEVHWDLINRKNPLQKFAFQIDTEDFWEDVMPVTINGQRALAMSPESLLIYLACHLMKESYSHQKWLTDIDRLILHYNTRIDWEAVVERAVKYAARRSVYHALNRVHESCRTPLPVGLLARIWPEPRGRSRGRFMKRDPSDDLMHKWWSATRLLLAIETSSDRIRAIMQLPPYLFARSFMLRRRPEEILDRLT
jgi:hypothetical protein